MFVLYSLFSTLLALLLAPLLLLALFVLLLIPRYRETYRTKYRSRIPARLGLGLRRNLAAAQRAGQAAPCLWIHALSVGEVTSALPLVRGLRHHLPEARIVLSVTTAAGQKVAAQLLGLDDENSVSSKNTPVDALIAAPFDLAPVLVWFSRSIRPDLFILVESDFWPNWLAGLARQQVPLALVNGRISAASQILYQRGVLFFRPMFRLFSLLSMQTQADRQDMQAMLKLEIDDERVQALGNLKFDVGIERRTESASVAAGARAVVKEDYGFPAEAPLWICGSTHPGEERILFQVHRRLRLHQPQLQLLLAPRDIRRADELLQLAAAEGLLCRQWSQERQNRATGKASAEPATEVVTDRSVLLLDTLGELAATYQMADLAFIGGSLGPFGGHNPLEAAVFGTPVFFGPHMEDFTEIAAGLCQGGGARQVADGEALLQVLQTLLAHPDQRQQAAQAAHDFVVSNQGVVQRHVEALEEILQHRHISY